MNCTQTGTLFHVILIYNTININICRSRKNIKFIIVQFALIFINSNVLTEILNFFPIHLLQSMKQDKSVTW